MLEGLKNAMVKLSGAVFLLKGAGMLNAKDRAIAVAEEYEKVLGENLIVLAELRELARLQGLRIAELENRQGIRHHG